MCPLDPLVQEGLWGRPCFHAFCLLTSSKLLTAAIASPRSTPRSTPTSCSKVEKAYPVLSMTSVCDRRRGSRQSASPNVHRSEGCTGCKGSHTATCSFILVTHEWALPGKAGTIDRGRDGRGRMTVLAFCMTPPWGAPKIRNPNGLSIYQSERKILLQAITTA